jgi:hypothetical protein
MKKTVVSVWRIQAPIVRLAMYARVPTFDVGTDNIEAAIRHFNDVSVPQLEEFEGFQSATMLVDRKKGIVRIIALYDSEQSIASTDAGAKHLRGEFLESIKDVRLVSLEIYEVAVQVGQAEFAGVSSSNSCLGGGC